MTEKRWADRKPFRTNVALVYDELGLICGRTRDLSLGGAYIETSAVAPATDAEIRLLFLDRCAHPDTVVSVRGTVVRSAGSGVGVMFTDFEKGALNSLRELVVAADADSTDPWQVAGASR